MRERGINLDEMPLGALTSERVQNASVILAEIGALLKTEPPKQEGGGDSPAHAAFRKRLQVRSYTFTHACVYIYTRDVSMHRER
jgi:hypothetical protein